MKHQAIQYAEEFDQRHGASVYENGIIYFVDGAMREANPMGTSYEPTPGEQQTLQYQLIYWTVKNKQAVTKFDELKTSLEREAKIILAYRNGVGNPPPDKAKTVQRLKRLLRVVRHSQAKLTEVREALNAGKSEFDKQRDQEREANQAAAREFLDAINKIER